MNLLRSLSICKFRVKRLSLCLVCLSFFSTAYYLSKTSPLTYFSCPIDEAQHAISIICNSYQHNAALGNMCQSLCSRGELKLLDCVGQHSGKEVVFKAKWRDQDVIFKSLHLHSSKYDQIYWRDASLVKNYPEVPHFYEMLSESISNTFNYSTLAKDETIVDKIWTLDHKFFLKLSPRGQHAAMNDMWHLIQQPEYLLSTLYSHLNVFPKIIGSCGHVFAVESLIPLPGFFSILHPSWRYDFAQRVRWALEILEMVSIIDHNFQPGLHLCDIKIGHMGLGKGKLKFLDLDMVFSDKSVKDNLALNACNNECSFIDCQGECDTQTHFCKRKILNNNLQRICKNIFLGLTWPRIFGLLSLPPPSISERLESLLRDCLNQSASNTQNLQGFLHSLVDNST